MPRYARRTAPHTVQHVIARFVNREYLLDEGAREEYLRRAAEAVARTDWRPLAFALMSSHVHWVLWSGEQPSADFVKPLHSGFAGWLNRTHKRLGPVFADRHRTVTFAGETAATLLAYVHNNPVRAGLAESAGASAWTSHLCYTGAVSAPPWLDVHRGLALAGFSPTRAGRRAFHEFVASRCKEVRCAMLSGEGMPGHRARARAALQAPVEVGSSTVTSRRGRRTLSVPTIVPAECRPLRHAISTTTVIGAVAQSVGLSIAAVRSQRRLRSVVQGRRLALLIWVRHLGQPAVRMACALGIAASTASKLITSASCETQTLAMRIVDDLVV